MDMDLKADLVTKKWLPGFTVILASAGGALLAGTLASLWGFTGAGIGLATAILASFGSIIAWVFLDERLKRAKRGPSAAIPADRVDELTGLANKNGFDAWLSEKSNQRADEKTRVIVLAADLSNFKQIVQSRGTEQANAVLKEAAGRVSSLKAIDGIAARIEGEEFAAVASVVPDGALEIATSQAGKLAELLQRPIELPFGVIWIGGSVGAAIGLPSEGNEVFERAKKALIKARNQNSGHFFVDGFSKE